MSVSVIEQARIQAQVLVPLVKALQAELGEARANALVRNALGDLFRRFGEEFWQSRKDKHLGKAVSAAFKAYATDDALAYDVVEQSEDAFAIDIRRCRYAEFYKELGEPELGFPAGVQRGLPCRRGIRRRCEADAHADHHAGRKPLRLPLPPGSEGRSGNDCATRQSSDAGPHQPGR